MLVYRIYLLLVVGKHFNNNTVNKIFNEKHTNIIAGIRAFQTKKFWLARVIDILDSGTYKLRYFKQQSRTKK